MKANLKTASDGGANNFTNGEIHEWHTIVWGYGDKLVGAIIDKLGVTDKDIVLDPFCGYGTTLVECKKRGIHSIGMDVNPAACFSSIVKTEWNIDIDQLRAAAIDVEKIYFNKTDSNTSLRNDKSYKYLKESGMIERGWISEYRLLNVIRLKHSISRIKSDSSVKQLLSLLLLNILVRHVSNVRFGPELYCAKPRKGVRVPVIFRKVVDTAISDLILVTEGQKITESKVIQGDSRRVAELTTELPKPPTVVITSPPYPAEHDYTRNTRLELALLEHVSDKSTLQKIKREMLRSHTKGIYKTDEDDRLVENDIEIDRICRRIDERAKEKTHGFARLYSKVVREYFGGMSKHFASLHEALAIGARCAYVVGDQESYLRVPIKTSKILGRLAEKAGFKNIRDITIRRRWSTVSSKKIKEHVLLFEKREI